MIKKFFSTLLNTEYLPMNEVRKIKVIVIFIFLTVFTALTLGVSYLLDYPTWVKSIFIGGFILALLITYGFIKLNLIFLAMQITIIQSVFFMVYYTQGITSFYAYLLFYIVLTIIAFYQEIYSYFVFSTFVTVLGIFYIFNDGDSLLINNDLPGAIYIYITGLILYYLVNFAFILINEKSYSEMNLEWIHDKKTNDSMQKDIFNFMQAIKRIQGDPPIYEDNDFQAAVTETSEFIAKQILKDGSEIKNISDLYFYIHEIGYQKILDNQNISLNMRKTTVNLKKYMVNDHSDLFSIMINFVLRHKKPNIDIDDLNLSNLNINKDEKLIVFAMIYVYMTHNLYQSSSWNKFEVDMNTKKVIDFDFEPFFDDQTIAFFQDNIEIIKKYLNK